MIMLVSEEERFLRDYVRDLCERAVGAYKIGNYEDGDRFLGRALFYQERFPLTREAQKLLTGPLFFNI